MSRLRPLRRDPRGQSLVEMSLILPFLLFLLLGAIEFGSAFSHHLTLEYASREGARVGAALANGGGPLGCGAAQSPNWRDVDPRIIAAVERVLAGSGTPIDIAEVSEIRIYKANAAGHPVSGAANIWTYTPGRGPVIDGSALDFSPSSQPWSACARTNMQPADSVGVSITYTYHTQTPFSAFIGWASMAMSDRTVMALNPTNQ